MEENIIRPESGNMPFLSLLVRDFSLQSKKELKEEFAKLFAKEGARVIRKMPQWTPGKVEGKPVRMKLHQPINFKMPQ